MSNYDYQDRTPSDITFESPSDPQSTLRFSRSIKSKSLNGVSLLNVRNELSVNRVIRSPVVESGPVVNEPISVKLIVSGSKERNADVAKAVATVFAAWNASSAKNRIGGLPTSNDLFTIDPQA